MPLEVLCSMQSSCGTCWRLIRRSREQQLHLGILKKSGIPLWVLDSNRRHEGHQRVHAAEAVQEDVVTEAPADDTEPVAPAPTLPMQAKVKKTAKVIPTQGTADGKGTPSSSKKQATGKEKEWDKPTESDDDDTDEE